MLEKNMEQQCKLNNLVIADHPLIQHKLAKIRNKNTTSSQFRQLLREISILMGCELTHNFPTEEITVDTPLEKTGAKILKADGIVVVPILRAGLGMLDGLLELMPDAKIGHIGLYRDKETKRPVEYLVKLPPTHNKECLLADPMLATGYSAAHAVDVLKKAGVPEQKIHLMTLVSAPEGVTLMQELHPGVTVYTASLDRELDENSYILPGLGDAGDRLYGTK